MFPRVARSSCVLLLGLAVVALGMPSLARAEALSYTYTIIDVPPPAGTRLPPLTMRGLANSRMLAGVFLGDKGYSARVTQGQVTPILCPPAAFTRYQFPALSGPEIYSMNNDGTVAGNDAGVDGIYGFTQTADGTCQWFRVPGSLSTYVFGINDRGAVVGIAGDPTRSGLLRTRGFLRDAGGVVWLDGPGPRDVVFPTAINALGDIVGYLYQNVQPDNSYTVQAFVVRHGRYELLDGPQGEDLFLVDINNRGQVLGYGLSGAAGSYFLWEDGAFATLSLPTPTTISFAAAALNDHGQLIASVVDSGPPRTGHQVLGSPAPSRRSRENHPPQGHGSQDDHARQHVVHHVREVRETGHFKVFVPALDDDGQVVLSTGRTVLGRGRR